MRSHLRPSPYNKRSQRKAALAKQHSADPARDERRQDGDCEPGPAREPTPVKTRRE